MNEGIKFFAALDARVVRQFSWQCLRPSLDYRQDQYPRVHEGHRPQSEAGPPRVFHLRP